MLEVEEMWVRMLKVQEVEEVWATSSTSSNLDLEHPGPRLLDFEHPVGQDARGPESSRSGRCVRILEVEEMSVRMLEVQHHVTRGRGGVGQARILLGTDILNPHSNCY